MNFGFTNDTIRYRKAIVYRNAAILDGWSCKALYPNEPMERVAKLELDGFVMYIFARTDIGSWKYEVDISIWGPDGLTIKPPDIYDMDAIRAGISRCSYCGKTDVKTQRVGFAGRTCEECLPKQREKQEYPGWCN